MFNLTAGQAVTRGVSTREANAEIEILPLIAETKMINCYI